MKNITLKETEIRIQEIKSALSKIGRMRPGSLTEQYKDSANKTGAYHQLSYTHNMKSKTDYIRKAHVVEIGRQIQNYKKFKELTEEWVALSIEHSKLTMKLKNN